MNKNKQKIFIESNGIRDWLYHISKSKKKKEYRLTELVNNDGKKKLSYDIKSYGKEDSELNMNVLKFPYKFSKLKIKNYDELESYYSICEQIAEPKDDHIKKKRINKKKIDTDNDEIDKDDISINTVDKDGIDIKAISKDDL